MKKIVLNTIVFLSLSIYGQDSLYFNSMKDALDSMNNIKSLEDFNNIANIFERIAKAEKDKWLPYYYTGYIYVILGFKQQGSENLDEYLDIAQENINRALEIKPEESELYALQGLLYQSRIMADPQARGPVYSPQATTALEKAIELDENNPRPYYLLGTNLFYTPEAYGGGLEAACPLLKTAKEKYENFTPADSISPGWGKEYNLQLLEKCQNLN
jgi:tetratricopeptide (TPR) repeat protein